MGKLSPQLTMSVRRDLLFIDLISDLFLVTVLSFFFGRMFLLKVRENESDSEKGFSFNLSQIFPPVLQLKPFESSS